MPVVYEEQSAPKFAFFSVSKMCEIGGMLYRPSICYPIDSMLEATVQKMEATGDAKRYTQAVRFVNGIARPAKKNAVV